MLHYSLGHHRLGCVFFRNHIRFHHTYYARGHLASANYRKDDGNNTPYFLIPTILVAGAMFFVLPLDLFLVTAVASAASFYAYVYFDKACHMIAQINPIISRAMAAVTTTFGLPLAARR